MTRRLPAGVSAEVIPYDDIYEVIPKNASDGYRSEDYSSANDQNNRAVQPEYDKSNPEKKSKAPKRILKILGIAGLAITMHVAGGAVRSHTIGSLLRDEPKPALEYVQDLQWTAGKIITIGVDDERE